jgi:hypothetical protein
LPRELTQKFFRVVRPHERFADQEAVKAGGLQAFNIGYVFDAALSDQR